MSEDADRVRAKRLARLQQPGSGRPSSAEEATRALAATNEAVHRQSSGGSVTVEEPRNPPLGRTAGLSPPASGIAAISCWAKPELEKVFVVSLSADDLANAEDISSLVDHVVVSRLMNNVSDVLFDYLLACYRRASGQHIPRSVKRTDQEGTWLELRSKCRELCVSYAGIVLQAPYIFPQPETSPHGPAYLLCKLLKDSQNASNAFDSDELVSKEFLADFGARFLDDGLEKIVESVYEEVMKGMKKTRLMDEWLPYLNSLVKLASVEPFARVMAHAGQWSFEGVSPDKIEHMWVLGSFLRLTPFPSGKNQRPIDIFGEQFRQSKSQIESTTSSVRLTLKNLYQGCFSILYSIVKSSLESRGIVLTCFQSILKANEKRAQMQVDEETVSSDGFMMNLYVVLLYFSERINMGKAHLIRTNYFVHPRRRVSISGETGLAASETEIASYRKEQQDLDAGPDPNFISDIVFLTARAMHLGFARCVGNYGSFLRHMADLRSQYERLSSERQNWAGTRIAPVLGEVMQRARKQLQADVDRKLAYDSQLLDSNILSRTFAFTNTLMAWILRVMTSLEVSDTFEIRAIKTPLCDIPPISWRILPEYMADDLAQFFSFLSRYSPSILGSQELEILIAFVLLILRHPQYVTNPYMRAKIAEILTALTYGYHGEPAGGLFAVVERHPLAKEHMFPSLMRLYVDVEKTGLSSQFYDKFTIRHNLQRIFKRMWETEVFREAIKSECDTETFVRFSNLLINDTTYLLDEGLAKLSEIRDLQVEMASREELNRRGEQYRASIERQLRQASHQASSYMMLANDTVHMLQYLTSEATQPFLTPEIVNRLAAMLDYNLDVLVGPKCQNLKVENPSAYHFNVKELLADIVGVYLHLSSFEEFVEAVAKDERSYSKENFSKAASVMSKYHLKPEATIKTLQCFVQSVEKRIETEKGEEEEMGDVPDEFLDPLMYTLMENPVRLPTSMMVVDMSTIKTHLLSDEHDPFNREPLRLEQVIPDDELRLRIEAFRAGARQRRQGGAG